jgi:hypothetical protein
VSTSKLLLRPSSFAEAMGFSARRAVKGNEQGIRACGSFAVDRVPLLFLVPFGSAPPEGFLAPPSTDVTRFVSTFWCSENIQNKPSSWPPSHYPQATLASKAR